MTVRNENISRQVLMRIDFQQLLSVLLKYWIKSFTWNWHFTRLRIKQTSAMKKRQSNQVKYYEVQQVSVCPPVFTFLHV